MLCQRRLRCATGARRQAQGGGQRAAVTAVRAAAAQRDGLVGAVACASAGRTCWPCACGLPGRRWGHGRAPWSSGRGCGVVQRVRAHAAAARVPPAGRGGAARRAGAAAAAAARTSAAQRRPPGARQRVRAGAAACRVCAAWCGQAALRAAAKPRGCAQSAAEALRAGGPSPRLPQAQAAAARPPQAQPGATPLMRQGAQVKVLRKRPTEIGLRARGAGVRRRAAAAAAELARALQADVYTSVTYVDSKCVRYFYTTVLQIRRRGDLGAIPERCWT